MSDYRWTDRDKDHGWVSTDPTQLEGDAVAIIEVGSGIDTGVVYVYPEQAKHLEAFFAAVVMSLPMEQRA